VAKRDGRQVSAALEPVPPDIQMFLPERALAFAIFIVGAIYLAIGVGVWWFKRDRPDSSALLLFCGVVAAQLFLASSYTAVGSVLNLITVPFIGATAFHLFTSYPTEPGWIVRHPEIRAIPYGLAALLAAFGVLEPYLGVPAGIAAPIGTFFTVDVTLICIGILFYQRWNRRRDATVDRSDVMLAGGALSFLPVIGLLMVHYFFGTPFPWHVALLGFFMFPAAVGYGIVRQQLFEIRMVAKSSAAYGAATLAITGLFAFLITFTDALVGRFNVNARSPLFPVAFLFTPGRWLLRPRSGRLPGGGPRDLRGDGLHALGEGDRRSHPRGCDGHDGGRGCDGAASGRQGRGPAPRSLPRRLGRRGRWRDLPLRPPSVSAALDAAHRAGPRGLRRG
jgi:hypothetical protein